jgi:hypothetical protein
MANQGSKKTPEWEDVLSAAARLQGILPDAVLVGGTAASLYAHHRMSVDADHILTDLRNRFDDVLADLELVSGWKTARVRRPVLILGSLDGIETGVRQLIRKQPLEVQTIPVAGGAAQIVLPTLEEMFRIKGVLILKRNATRDYLDFAAMGDHLGSDGVDRALSTFNDLYPQVADTSSLQQLQIQLSAPQPYDLEGSHLAEYKHLTLPWQNWQHVEAVCKDISMIIMDRVIQDVKMGLEEDAATADISASPAATAGVNHEV